MPGSSRQNVYRYNVCLCSSVVLAHVLEYNCHPAGENELSLSFVVGTCVFLLLASACMIRDTSVLIMRKNVDADHWFRGRNVDAAAAKRRNCRVLLQKKQFSKSSDKTSSTTGSSAATFLVDMICTQTVQTPVHWHPKIPIK